MSFGLRDELRKGQQVLRFFHYRRPSYPYPFIRLELRRRKRQKKKIIYEIDLRNNRFVQLTVLVTSPFSFISQISYLKSTVCVSSPIYVVLAFTSLDVESSKLFVVNTPVIRPNHFASARSTRLTLEIDRAEER